MKFVLKSKMEYVKGKENTQALLDHNDLLLYNISKYDTFNKVKLAFDVDEKEVVFELDKNTFLADVITIFKRVVIFEVFAKNITGSFDNHIFNMNSNEIFDELQKVINKYNDVFEDICRVYNKSVFSQIKNASPLFDKYKEVFVDKYAYFTPFSTRGSKDPLHANIKTSYISSVTFESCFDKVKRTLSNQAYDEKGSYYIFSEILSMKIHSLIVNNTVNGECENIISLYKFMFKSLYVTKYIFNNSDEVKDFDLNRFGYGATNFSDYFVIVPAAKIGFLNIFANNFLGIDIFQNFIFSEDERNSSNIYELNTNVFVVEDFIFNTNAPDCTNFNIIYNADYLKRFVKRSVEDTFLNTYKIQVENIDKDSVREEFCELYEKTHDYIINNITEIFTKYVHCEDSVKGNLISLLRRNHFALGNLGKLYDFSEVTSSYENSGVMLSKEDICNFVSDYRKNKNEYLRDDQITFIPALISQTRKYLPDININDFALSGALEKFIESELISYKDYSYDRAFHACNSFLNIDILTSMYMPTKEGRFVIYYLNEIKASKLLSNSLFNVLNKENAEIQRVFYALSLIMFPEHNFEISLSKKDTDLSAFKVKNTIHFLDALSKKSSLLKQVKFAEFFERIFFHDTNALRKDEYIGTKYTNMTLKAVLPRDNLDKFDVKIIQEYISKSLNVKSKVGELRYIAAYYPELIDSSSAIFMLASGDFADSSIEAILKQRLSG